MDGYKCFNNNFTNNYNNTITPNKTYIYKDKIKVKKSGFHFCKRLEDTLRYYNGLNEEVIICKVKALGQIEWYDDEYYGYYDIGCTNKIYISKPLTRKEVIEYADSLIDIRFIRFIEGYKLTTKELEYFKNKYSFNRQVINHIKYYQENDQNAFSINSEKAKKKIKNII